MVISDLTAFAIFDSRGNPTVKIKASTDQGIIYSSIPSGASVGAKEAPEIRDENGYGVNTAIDIINTNKHKFLNKRFTSLVEFDGMLADTLTINDILYGNVSLGLSIIAAKYFFNFQTSKYVTSKLEYAPTPMINIIGGGLHADNNINIQEFLLIPVASMSYYKALELARKIFLQVKKQLKNMKMSTGLGDEGGFAPAFNNSIETLDFLTNVINTCGLKDVFVLGLDVAANELYQHGQYHIDEQKLTKEELLKFYQQIAKNYPVYSIEDPFSEHDHSSFVDMTNSMPSTMIVGDDVFASNIELLEHGILHQYGNAIIIKPNQIGLVSKAIKTIKKAKQNNYKVIPAHRSGDTEDSFISELCYITRGDFIKIGGINRGERTNKHNKILELFSSCNIRNL